MKQPARLHSAKTWVPSYQGKNIVQGYRKNYEVDLLCGIRELEMLGIRLKPEYVKAVKQSLKEKALEKQRKTINVQEELEGVYGVDYDEFFSYIAGHTEGGASYGVPWEE